MRIVTRKHTEAHAPKVISDEAIFRSFVLEGKGDRESYLNKEDCEFVSVRGYPYRIKRSGVEISVYLTYEEASAIAAKVRAYDASKASKPEVEPPLAILLASNIVAKGKATHDGDTLITPAF
jgi:hypothetical protein